MTTNGSQAVRHFGGRQDAVLLASNSLSLAILAFSGIAINVLLARRFGADVVGQFNQLTALHLVAAQLAAFGIHLSCLHYLSTQIVGSQSWAVGSRAALGAVFVVGCIVAGALSSGAGLIESLLGSPGLAEGIYWLAPAVALFGINKVLQAICNASDRLHALAFLQALRPIAWLIGMAVAVHVGSVGPAGFGKVLLVGELAAMLSGVVALSSVWHGPLSTNYSGWLLRHFQFGIRAMPSHLITDLNARIDILILAFFSNDVIVGIYSFVAVLAEGVFQIGVLIRTVISRRLVGVLVSHDHSALRSLRRQSSRWSLILTLISAAVLSAVFAPAVSWLGLEASFVQGKFALWVLLGGVVACAMYSPLWIGKRKSTSANTPRSPHSSAHCCTSS